jgi:hypothetical protein
MAFIRRVIARALLFCFILLTAMLPLPMVPFMAFLVRQTPRRSHPTKVERKRREEHPELDESEPIRVTESPERRTRPPRS